MLWLLQIVPQVAPQLPPIQITVQSPPGMPEWIKILISAGVGALFGILGNMAMEILKPQIGTWLKRRELEKQAFRRELKANVDEVDGIRRLAARAANATDHDRTMTLHFIVGTLNNVLNVWTQRYDSWSKNQVAILDAIDPEKALGDFYLKVVVAHDFAEALELEPAVRALDSAAAAGKALLAKHGITFTPSQSRWDQYLQPKDHHTDGTQW